MNNKKYFKYQIIGTIVGFIIAILILVFINKYIKTEEPVIIFIIGIIIGSSFSYAGSILGMAIYNIKY